MIFIVANDPYMGNIYKWKPPETGQDPHRAGFGAVLLRSIRSIFLRLVDLNYIYFRVYFKLRVYMILRVSMLIDMVLFFNIVFIILCVAC